MERQRIELSHRPAAPHDGTVQIFVHLHDHSVAEYVASGLASGRPPTSQEQQAWEQQLASTQQSFRRVLAELEITELSSFQMSLNGFRVRLASELVADLASHPWVARVTPVAHHIPANETSVPWIGAPELWNTLGIRGAGMTIAVIDTGVDYLHVSMGGSGDPGDFAANDPALIEPGTFPTEKVIGGFDFAGNSFDAGGVIGSTTPSPDPDPLDLNGHGTHVAATAAGMETEGSVGAGVAPDASIVALKVFGNSGGSTDLVADAIEWALDPNGDGSTDDRVDVINMSLGSDFGGTDDVAAIAAQNAAELGVIVVAAAGNAGDVPYVMSSPAVAPGVISVAASVDGGLTVPGLLVTSPPSIAGRYEAAESAIGQALATAGEVAGLVVAADPLDGCSPLVNSQAIAGNIALISRGNCLFSVKHLSAQDAGGIAAIVFNDVPGPPSVMGGDSAGIEIPAVMISQADGQLLLAEHQGGQQVGAVLSPDIVIAKPELADTTTAFSSGGPARGDSSLKPDVAAPGFSIRSAAFGSGDAALELSGTSMASPHVAGAAALLRERFPQLPVPEIKALLQNSSVAAAVPSGSESVPLTRQGVGVIRVDRAAFAEVVATPGSVSFGRLNPTEAESFTEEIVLQSLTDEPRVFTIRHVPGRTSPGATVSVPSTVSLGGETAEFEVTLDLDPARLSPDTTSFSQTEVDGWFLLDDGANQLRIGYLAVIDPAAEILASAGGQEIDLENAGLATGLAEAFTRLALDEKDVGLDKLGVRTGSREGVEVVDFGIAMTEPWSTLSAKEIDVFLDTDQDGSDDFVLVAADLGRLLGGSPTGTIVTALFDLRLGFGQLQWPVAADFNDRVATLSVDRRFPAGFLQSGDDTFDLRVEVIDLGTGAIIEVQAEADLAVLMTVTPDSIELPAGGSVTADVLQPPETSASEVLWLLPANRPRQQETVVEVGG